MTALAALALGLISQGSAPKPNAAATVTGCLSKGDAGTYTLLMSRGRKLIVSGAAELEKHAANHTVRLAGTRKGRTFDATAVTHIAAECRPAQGASDPGGALLGSDGRARK